MIEITKFRNLGDFRIKKIAGIYWTLNRCIGINKDCKRDKKNCLCCCKRDDKNGDHSKHVWEDMIMISDPIQSEFAVKKGERWQDGEVWTTARWFNFEYCVFKIMSSKKTRLVNSEIINSALKMAEDECFGVDGEIINMAQKAGTNYSQLLKIIEAEISKYVY